MNREEAIQSIATALAQQHLDEGCYSPTNFFGIFGRESFSQDQSLSMALAEWHALFASATVFSFWNALGADPNLVKDIVEVFQQRMMEAVKDTCQDEFINIINVREPDYIQRMKDALRSDTSIDFFKLSGLMVRRITGRYDEELEATGVHGPTDALTAVVIKGLVLSDMTRTKEFLLSSAVQDCLW